MKFFVIAALLSLVLVPVSAESAGGVYHVTTFRAGIREAMKGEVWKTCGDYFATVETPKGRVVHFSYEMRLPDSSSTIFAFTKADRISVLVKKNVATPMVTTLENRFDVQFVLEMDAEHYKIGLPCLARITKT